MSSSSSPKVCFISEPQRGGECAWPPALSAHHFENAAVRKIAGPARYAPSRLPTRVTAPTECPSYFPPSNARSSRSAIWSRFTGCINHASTRAVSSEPGDSKIALPARVNGSAIVPANSGYRPVCSLTSMPSVIMTSARPAMISWKMLRLSGCSTIVARVIFSRVKRSLVPPGFTITRTPG